MYEFARADEVIEGSRRLPLMADTVAKVESCRAPDFSRNYETGSNRRFV
jgi:hypothetical protein